MQVLKNFKYLQSDSDFEVMICDFGFGRDFSTNELSTKIPVGVPKFMAWEQEDSHKTAKASLKADSWSLGALFLHTLHPIRRPERYHEHDDDFIKLHIDKEFDLSDPALVIFKEFLLKMLV